MSRATRGKALASVRSDHPDAAWDGPWQLLRTPKWRCWTRHYHYPGATGTLLRGFAWPVVAKEETR